jgi:hypothetical protein
MAISNLPFFSQSVQLAGLAITSATAGTPQTLITPGLNGCKVDWINAQTTDTAANVIQLNLYNGTTQFPISQVNVPAASGNAVTAPVSLFASGQLPTFTYDSNGNKFIYIPSGWTLTVTVTAVTSAKTLTLTAQYENF